MLHIALFEPEIPPNTGNIARLCAATGTRLHLIGKLGFRIDEKAVRRAGLDYWPSVDLVTHATFEEFLANTESPPTAVGELWCIETPGDIPFTKARFQDGDCLLFGKESVGLPASILEAHAGRVLGIPMPAGKVRSLNLSTAAGIVLYEALRQIHNW